MDGQAALAAIRRHLGLIAAIAIIAGIGAFVVSMLLPRTYASSVTLLVGSPNTSDYDQILAAQLQAQTYAELATTQPVLDGAAGRVGVAGAALRDVVSVRTPRSTPFVTITARDGNASRAAELANAVAAELMAIETPPGDAVFELTVVDPGTAPRNPDSPRPLLNAVIAVLAGLVVGVLIALMSGTRAGGFSAALDRGSRRGR
jgi:capsular polysaccharide biosynthesis protein